MDDYNRGGHTKYCIMVHIIVVTKYRKNVFIEKDISDSVRNIILKYCQNIIGSVLFYGQVDSLPVVLARCQKKQ